MGEVHMFDGLDYFTNPTDGEALPDDNALFNEDTPPEYRFTTDTTKKRGEILSLSPRLALCLHHPESPVSYVRLLDVCRRNDRSSVLVTQSFEHKSNPEHLIDLAWQLLNRHHEGRKVTTDWFLDNHASTSLRQTPRLLPTEGSATNRTRGHTQRRLRQLPQPHSQEGYQEE